MMERADTLRRDGRLRAAVEVYAQVIDRRPSAGLGEEAAFRQAELLHRLGESESALTVLQAAARRHPRGILKPERTALQARIHIDHDRLTKALRVLDTVKPPSLEIYRLQLDITRRLLPEAPEKALERLRMLERAPLPDKLHQTVKTLLSEVEEKL